MDATGECKSGAFPLPPRPVGRILFKSNLFFSAFSGNTHLLLVAECFRHLLALPQLGTLGRVCCRGKKGYKNYTFAKTIYDARFVFQPISLTYDKVLRTAVVNSEHHGFADIVWDGAEKKKSNRTHS